MWVDLAYSGTEAWTKDLPTLTGGTWREIADLIDVENLVGTSASDFLRGDGNDNSIDGGAGDDVLVNTVGADWLRGGTGSDLFVFNHIDGTADTVADFMTGVGGDALELRDVLVGYDPNSSDLSTFVQLLSSSSDTMVMVNADGIGTDFISLVTLSGVATSSTLLNDMLIDGNLMIS